MKSKIIIGTRGSELALWQANFTKSVLESNGIEAELKIIQTKGDATQQWNLSFSKIEGKGFFTKELEEALLSGEIDLAVHSCKDLPTTYPDGLTIAAYSKRANPFDVLLIRKESTDHSRILKLKKQAVVGTSSSRRKSQLAAFRPDIELQDLRGNVPTRVNRLRSAQYDAIVLASAGLERLNIDLSEFEKVILKAPMFIPAPAQGVLAFQIRENDDELKEICSLLHDEASTEIAEAERLILHDFEGGCQMPLGVYAEKHDDRIHLWISQAASADTIPKRAHIAGFKKSDALDIVRQLKNSQPATVFVSSELKEDDYFKRVLEAHHYKVSNESFIDFSPVKFDLPAETGWLFFSSKNGVKYFFAGIAPENIKGVKFAAINQGTAQALLELGYPVDFTGEGGDLQKIAEDFDAIAVGSIVFPQAKQSQQSVQRHLVRNKQAHALVVYENQPRPEPNKRDEQVLVFTSPMSAEAYFSTHILEENQQVISIGNTTTRKLLAMGVSRVKTAVEPSFWSILDELFLINWQRRDTPDH